MSPASGILPNWNGVSDVRLIEVTTVHKGELIFHLAVFSGMEVTLVILF